MVDFGMLGVLLSHLLVALLLLPALLLTHGVQPLLPLVRLQHLVLLELVVAALVVVLQVVGRLQLENKWR